MNMCNILTHTFAPNQSLPSRFVLPCGAIDQMPGEGKAAVDVSFASGITCLTVAINSVGRTYESTSDPVPPCMQEKLRQRGIISAEDAPAQFFANSAGITIERQCTDPAKAAIGSSYPKDRRRKRSSGKARRHSIFGPALIEVQVIPNG